MISSFSCQNFKCFKDTSDIKLTPITLIVGPNNSGKSSLISALNILSLTSYSEDNNIYLKLSSRDEYDYGTYKDIVFKHQEELPLTLSITIPKPSTNHPLLTPKIIDSFVTGDLVTFVLKYGYLKQRQEIYLENMSLRDSKGEFFSICEDKYTKKIKVESKFITNLKRASSWFFKSGISYNVRIRYISKRYEREWDRLLYISMLLDTFKQSLKNIHHLGPLRVAPLRSYLFSGELTDRIGDSGEKALLNYATMSKRRSSMESGVLNNINKDLFKLGFMSKLSYKKVGDRHYEFWTEHPSSKLEANLADTGFGASQVIPVIFLLYTAVKDSIIMVEQPELHLHPAAQAELGTVFVKACKNRGIKTVIETHSETFILRLLTEVANGNLGSDELSIFYVLPEIDGHKILKIPVNEKGEFLVDWPQGFFEESFYESIRLTKARMGK